MRVMFIITAATMLLELCCYYSEAVAVEPCSDCQRAPNVLRVGAFNIQTFGKAKMNKAHVAEWIRKIVERYDILLIQEIRDQSLDSVRQLLGMLTLPFDFVISEPLGRTSYKEQYAFFYRTDKVVLLSSYQYEDPNDVFEREPLAVRMAPKTYPQQAITLIALHSRPDDATAEIGHMKDVIASVQSELDTSGTTEPVVLGDLNADCSYATLEKRRAANDYMTVTEVYNWLIGEDADTTTRDSTNCAYDRIIIRTGLMSNLVGGSVLVFNYQQFYGMTETEALEVSDHYPVEMQLSY